MGHMKVICLILLSLLLLNCNNNQGGKSKKIVDKWVGHKIILPGLSEKEQNYSCNSLKVITRINGDCYPCLTKLKDWSKFISEINNDEHKIPLYFYIVTSDSSRYNEINRKEIKFDYPVIHDLNNDFLKKNKLLHNSYLQTMLLDKDNCILLIGNPLNGSKLHDLYKKIIKNYHYD